MGSYQVRLITESDFKVIKKMMEICFKKSLSISYFDWRYKQNPSGKIIGFLAETKDLEPAAFYSFMPRTITIGGHKTIVYQSVDGMTTPMHRKKGLFRLLHQVGDEYLKVNGRVGVSYSGPVTANVKLDYGWEKVTLLRNYVYPVEFTYFRKLRMKRENFIEIKNYLDIEHLLIKCSDDNIISFFKDKRIYEWRTGNPRCTFKTFAFVNLEGKTSSFFSYYISKNKIILFDFFFENELESKLCIDYLCYIMKRNKFKAIISFCQDGSMYSEKLRKEGFITNRMNFGPLRSTMPFTISIPNNSNFKIDTRVGYNWNLNEFGYDGG